MERELLNLRHDDSGGYELLVLGLKGTEDGIEETHWQISQSHWKLTVRHQFFREHLIAGSQLPLHEKGDLLIYRRVI